MFAVGTPIPIRPNHDSCRLGHATEARENRKCQNLRPTYSGTLLCSLNLRLKSFVESTARSAGLFNMAATMARMSSTCDVTRMTLTPPVRTMAPAVRLVSGGLVAVHAERPSWKDASTHMHAALQGAGCRGLVQRLTCLCFAAHRPRATGRGYSRCACTRRCAATPRSATKVRAWQHNISRYHSA